MSLTPISLFSPSDENIQLEALGEEFELVGISDGENISDFEFWDIEMHWYCEDNDHICSSYLSEDLCGEMLRYCEDNTNIILIMIYRSFIWS